MSGINEIRQAGIKRLARREHSRYELMQKLQQKFGQTALIDDVINALCEENLLSDERYADAYVRSRASRGYGPQRIQNELQQKYVADDLIAKALSQEDVHWSEVLIDVWRKRFGIKPGDLLEKSKQVKFLHYRGFAIDEIEALMRSEL